MVLSCLYCSEIGEELLICSVMENVWDPSALSRPSIFEVETGSKTGRKKGNKFINDHKVTMYSNVISNKQISNIII